ncbi:MAG: hypothetical protein HUU55_00295 [Myxococcales bacterium]|nr:hypothetical protein [Myxococcales bacterium]
MKTDPCRIGVILLSTIVVPGIATADPFGDVTNDNQVNVVDAQCATLAVLWTLDGQAGSPPDCATGGASTIDVDCDGTLTVSDVLVIIQLALSAPLANELDSDGNGIPDDCEAGSSCSDSAVCTPGQWQCVGNQVQFCTALEPGNCYQWGTATLCDDGIACTDDDCHTDVGCLHVANPTLCDDGDVCTQDVCDIATGCTHLPENGPCQWIGKFAMSSQNPVLVPTPTAANQGADNCYAPSVLRVGNEWWMWYGAQGADGHDQIFFAKSIDLVTWQKHPTWTNPAPVISNGTSNHVNDPSVVNFNGKWIMAYTDAATGEDDRVFYAESKDGLQWTKHGEIIGIGSAGAWDSGKVGRPAIVVDGDTVWMWYDGQKPGGGRHVGVAMSSDGKNFVKYEANPVILNAGAVDVAKVGDFFVLLAEGGDGTHMYLAKNPFQWQYRGLLLAKSGATYDKFGQVTPTLIGSGLDHPAILFGGASDPCWCKNRIALALLGPDIAGCSSCLAGQPSCQAACNNQDKAVGVCGAPGSINPSACCSCCDNLTCVSCTPQCSGKQCGDDGCGGICGICSPDKVCQGGSCITQTPTLESTYRGTTLVRPGHDYGPAIVQAEDGIWHMWWCGSPAQATGAWDSIWYATSTDGLNWTCPSEAVKVSQSGLDADAVCDPAVVKVNDTWWMYYTGIHTAVDWSNRIFLAKSEKPGGPWTKYPNNDNPVPILSDSACNGADPGDYCVGQSAVVYKNGVFYHWFTDSGKGPGAFPSPLPTMLALSTNGVDFILQNNGQPVFNHADTDVVWDKDSEMFVMVYGNVDDNKLYWTTSNDGVAFLPHDDSRTLDVKLAHGQNHNPGLAGDVFGHITSYTFEIHGAGTGWGVWDLERTDVHFGISAQKPNGCANCVGGNDCPSACGGHGYCAILGSTDPSACCNCPSACTPAVTDCSLCLSGAANCEQACIGAGFSTGVCANPGSTNPAACCACGYSNCKGCLGGYPTCDEACKAAGKKSGTCAFPESADPSQCCVCEEYGNCEACLNGFPNCTTACQHSGYPGGVCAAPSSTNPAQCCACLPDTGCEQCLSGASTCMKACQNAGKSGGYCAAIGSTNPSACCACF